MIKHWNHVVYTTDDKPVCLCPDAETATEIAQALENQKPLEALKQLADNMRYYLPSTAKGYITNNQVQAVLKQFK